MRARPVVPGPGEWYPFPMSGTVLLVEDEDQVKRLVDADRRSVFEARSKSLQAAYHSMVEQWKSDATIGWDASPITIAHLCAELYDQIRNDDWSMVGNGNRVVWPRRLWNFDRHYRWIGSSGGSGIGYNAPASLGAALANRIENTTIHAIERASSATKNGTADARPISAPIR